MAEVNYPAETIWTSYHCDTETCTGVVIQDPNRKIAFMSDPIQFPHVCDTCGREYVFYDKYPKITYRRLGQG